MTEKKVTRHQCPVCKDIIYNDVLAFHDHLSNVCAQTLFSKYPGLKSQKFNALWYKLEEMVKEKIIIPSGQKGVTAIVHQSHQPPPGYYNHPNYQTHRHHPQAQKPQTHAPKTMDLEDIDRSISYRERDRVQREKDRIQERKRRRYEMEQEISHELNLDEFTKSMPKLDDAPKSKKRRLLYHNTSDIRPPKRVNIDPSISIDLFQHKIRQTRRKYHNVSFYDFANAKENEMNVDQHPAIIHAQRALTRYLLHCEMLRKCFNGELFVKIAKKFDKVYSENYSETMKATLNEINVWQNFEKNEEQKEEKEEKPNVEKQEFLSSWDAIKHQTDEYHLDKLLERETLCGIYAKLDKEQTGINAKEKHTFWNASNNVKHVGFHKSIFENAQNKKYIEL